MTFFQAGLSTDEKNLLTVFPKSLAHHSRVFHSSVILQSTPSQKILFRLTGDLILDLIVFTGIHSTLSLLGL